MSANLRMAYFGSHNSTLFPSGSYTHPKRWLSVVAVQTAVLVPLMVIETSTIMARSSANYNQLVGQRSHDMGLLRNPR